MTSVEDLNKIVSSGYKNVDSLEPYKIFGFEIYKSEAYNKIHECVRVNIENGFLILPERFDSALHKMKKMNTDNLYIIFQGRNGNRLNIEFEEKK